MLNTILCVLVLSTSWHASARPTSLSTRATHEQTPKEALSGAIGSYLSTFGVKAPSFYALNGWTTVDFAGQGASNTKASAANTIYHTLDAIQDLTGKGQNQPSFSNQYMTFIQELGKALNLNDTKKEEKVKGAQKAEVDACGKKADVLQTLLKEWQEGGGAPVSSTTDEKFLAWAQQDARYTTVQFDCQDKTNKYSSTLSSVYGDNFAVFSGALNNIKPLIESDKIPVPGISMDISGDSSGTPVDGPQSNGAGKVVPYYSIPPLNSTLIAWQKGEQLVPFNTSNAQLNSSNTETSSSGSGGLSFVWGRASVGAEASNEHTTNTTNVSAQSISISFGAIALMEINSGMWNDKGASAGAILNAPKGDDAKKPEVQNIFKQYIGTQQKPGPAALWNDKALIVYQPRIDITFASEDSFNSFDKTSAGAQGCFLFICLGGNGEQTKKMTTSNKATHSISYHDTTKNAYIVGYVQTGFWAQSSSGKSGGDKGGNGGNGGDTGGY